MKHLLTHHIKPEDRPYVGSMIILADHNREMGRYGDVGRVAKFHGVDKELLDIVLDNVETDYVADKLMEKRGTDADRPLEPPNRRDHIEAALDHHNAIGDTE
jgi:hypothetical protein